MPCWSPDQGRFGPSGAIASPASAGVPGRPNSKAKPKPNQPALSGWVAPREPTSVFG